MSSRSRRNFYLLVMLCGVLTLGLSAWQAWPRFAPATTVTSRLSGCYATDGGGGGGALTTYTICTRTTGDSVGEQMDPTDAGAALDGQVTIEKIPRNRIAPSESGWTGLGIGMLEIFFGLAFLLSQRRRRAAVDVPDEPSVVAA